MNIYTTDKIRNVVLLGHGGAGKTSLVDTLIPGRCLQLTLHCNLFHVMNHLSVDYILSKYLRLPVTKG